MSHQEGRLAQDWRVLPFQDAVNWGMLDDGAAPAAQAVIANRLNAIPSINVRSKKHQAQIRSSSSTGDRRSSSSSSSSSSSGDSSGAALSTSPEERIKILEKMLKENASVVDRLAFLEPEYESCCKDLNSVSKSLATAQQQLLALRWSSQHELQQQKQTSQEDLQQQMSVNEALSQLLEVTVAEKLSLETLLSEERERERKGERERIVGQAAESELMQKVEALTLQLKAACDAADKAGEEAKEATEHLNGCKRAMRDTNIGARLLDMSILKLQARLKGEKQAYASLKASKEEYEGLYHGLRAEKEHREHPESLESLQFWADEARNAASHAVQMDADSKPVSAERREHTRKLCVLASEHAGRVMDAVVAEVLAARAAKYAAWALLSGDVVMKEYDPGDDESSSGEDEWFEAGEGMDVGWDGEAGDGEMMWAEALVFRGVNRMVVAVEGVAGWPAVQGLLKVKRWFEESLE